MPFAIHDTPTATAPKQAEQVLRRKFDAAVGGTLFRQMMKSMRKMHDKPAYFHGGQAEEMFQNQIDEQVADDLAQRHGKSFTDPLFESFASQLRAHTIRSNGSGAATR